MATAPRPASTESQARRYHLLRLRDELGRRGIPVRVVKGRRGRLMLKLASESVLCAGAEGVYAHVTRNGRNLAPASDEGLLAATRHLAQGAHR